MNFTLAPRIQLRSAIGIYTLVTSILITICPEGHAANSGQGLATPLIDSDPENTLVAESNNSPQEESQKENKFLQIQNQMYYTQAPQPAYQYPQEPKYNPTTPSYPPQPMQLSYSYQQPPQYNQSLPLYPHQPMQLNYPYQQPPQYNQPLSLYPPQPVQPNYSYQQPPQYNQPPTAYHPQAMQPEYSYQQQSQYNPPLRAYQPQPTQLGCQYQNPSQYNQSLHSRPEHPYKQQPYTPEQITPARCDTERRSTASYRSGPYEAPGRLPSTNYGQKYAESASEPASEMKTSRYTTEEINSLAKKTIKDLLANKTGNGRRSNEQIKCSKSVLRAAFDMHSDNRPIEAMNSLAKKTIKNLLKGKVNNEITSAEKKSLAHAIEDIIRCDSDVISVIREAIGRQQKIYVNQRQPVDQEYINLTIEALNSPLKYIIAHRRTSFLEYLRFIDKYKVDTTLDDVLQNVLDTIEDDGTPEAERDIIAEEIARTLLDIYDRAISRLEQIVVEPDGDGSLRKIYVQGGGSYEEYDVYDIEWVKSKLARYHRTSDLKQDVVAILKKALQEGLSSILDHASLTEHSPHKANFIRALVKECCQRDDKKLKNISDRFKILLHSGDSMMPEGVSDRKNWSQEGVFCISNSPAWAISALVSSARESEGNQGKYPRISPFSLISTNHADRPDSILGHLLDDVMLNKSAHIAVQNSLHMLALAIKDTSIFGFQQAIVEKLIQATKSFDPSTLNDASDSYVGELLMQQKLISVLLRKQKEYISTGNTLYKQMDDAILKLESYIDAELNMLSNKAGLERDKLMRHILLCLNHWLTTSGHSEAAEVLVGEEELFNGLILGLLTSEFLNPGGERSDIDERLYMLALAIKNAPASVFQQKIIEKLIQGAKSFDPNALNNAPDDELALIVTEQKLMSLLLRKHRGCCIEHEDPYYTEIDYAVQKLEDSIKTCMLRWGPHSDKAELFMLVDLHNLLVANSREEAAKVIMDEDELLNGAILELFHEDLDPKEELNKVYKRLCVLPLLIRNASISGLSRKVLDKLITVASSRLDREALSNASESEVGQVLTQQKLISVLLEKQKEYYAKHEGPYDNTEIDNAILKLERSTESCLRVFSNKMGWELDKAMNSALMTFHDFLVENYCYEVARTLMHEQGLLKGQILRLFQDDALSPGGKGDEAFERLCILSLLIKDTPSSGLPKEVVDRLIHIAASFDPSTLSGASDADMTYLIMQQKLMSVLLRKHQEYYIEHEDPYYTEIDDAIQALEDSTKTCMAESIGEGNSAMLSVLLDLHDLLVKGQHLKEAYAIMDEEWLLKGLILELFPDDALSHKENQMKVFERLCALPLLIKNTNTSGVNHASGLPKEVVDRIITKVASNLNTKKAEKCQQIDLIHLVTQQKLLSVLLSKQENYVKSLDPHYEQNEYYCSNEIYYKQIDDAIKSLENYVEHFLPKFGPDAKETLFSILSSFHEWLLENHQFEAAKIMMDEAELFGGPSIAMSRLQASSEPGEPGPDDREDSDSNGDMGEAQEKKTYASIVREKLTNAEKKGHTNASTQKGLSNTNGKENTNTVTRKDVSRVGESVEHGARDRNDRPDLHGKETDRREINEYQKDRREKAKELDEEGYEPVKKGRYRGKKEESQKQYYNKRHINEEPI